MERRAAPYWNPYLAGAGLGLVLVFAYVVLGTGLGASGAVARTAAVLADRVAPAATEQNAYFGPWFAEGSPLAHYLVFMALGVFLGGFGSALAAGRIAPGIERGVGTSPMLRLALALGGGVLAGFASRLAQGCTSGQALSGGALLLSGSWAFMFAVFAGGFGAAWFVRKEWQA
ncbi:MAG: YeeE/YedE family protein [Planctomycetes bacterium]|nr:YeeE/YedE family protein [Planctomycetota bacterium]